MLLFHLGQFQWQKVIRVQFIWNWFPFAPSPGAVQEIEHLYWFVYGVSNLFANGNVFLLLGMMKRVLTQCWMMERKLSRRWWFLMLQWRICLMRYYGLQVTEDFEEARISSRGFGILDVGFRSKVCFFNNLPASWKCLLSNSFWILIIGPRTIVGLPVRVIVFFPSELSTGCTQDAVILQIGLLRQRNTMQVHNFSQLFWGSASGGTGSVYLSPLLSFTDCRRRHGQLEAAEFCWEQRMEAKPGLVTGWLIALPPTCIL